MQRFLSQHRFVIIWQMLFLLLGTTWLLAPHLNRLLSPRVSLISQYEAAGQPYGWMFRLGDIIAALLLASLAYILDLPKTPQLPESSRGDEQVILSDRGVVITTPIAEKLLDRSSGDSGDVGILGKSSKQYRRRKSITGWLLLIIAGGLFIDALVPTSCRQAVGDCREYVSVNFIIHALETIITSTALFGLSVYDALTRKKLVSWAFAFFQVAYGLLFVSQLANQQRFNTFSQFMYQTILIVWLAWLIRDFWVPPTTLSGTSPARHVKTLAAVAAYLGGLISILASLADIHLLGRLRGYYFAGDTAWMAQHSIIIGIIMLYLARHLARGELRARQIFLVVTGLETLKYAVITPHPVLLLFYWLLFTALFAARDDFDRGALPMTLQVRLKDLAFMAAALLMAVSATLISLDRDSRVASITGRAFKNFTGYVTWANNVLPLHARSVLLANTFSVFLLFGAGSLLWILFRPYKQPNALGGSAGNAQDTLRSYSTSSEDFFKLWPPDKQYFWNETHTSFIAYKVVGPIIFALADPIGPDTTLLKNFMDWARAHRLRACFLPVAHTSLALYKKADYKTLQIGSTAMINVGTFLTKTAMDKWWRWQKNRAEKAGYQFNKAIPPHSNGFLRQLREVSDSWLAKDGREERGFALGYFDELYLQQCVILFVTDASGEAVAFANELPALKPSPVVSIDLFRHRADAEQATSYLLLNTIESHKATHAYFDLGFVPFAKARGTVLSIARILSRNRFSSKGLEQFKNKFDPDWQPVYLVYDGDVADLALIALRLEEVMRLQP